jgi:hypothetical protein
MLGPSRTEHVRQVLLTPRVLQLRYLQVGWISTTNTAAFFGMCLVQRAALGLRPLSLYVEDLSSFEVESLVAELADFSVTGGYKFLKFRKWPQTFIYVYRGGGDVP